MCKIENDVKYKKYTVSIVRPFCKAVPNEEVGALYSLAITVVGEPTTKTRGRLEPTWILRIFPIWMGFDDTCTD